MIDRWLSKEAMHSNTRVWSLKEASFVHDMNYTVVSVSICALAQRSTRSISDDRIIATVDATNRASEITRPYHCTRRRQMYFVVSNSVM